MEDLKNKLSEFLKNDYEFIEYIGDGSTAFVYRYKYKKLSQNRVIKILKPGLLEIDKFLKCFNTEIQALTEVHHQNVIRILDRGSIEIEENHSKKELPYYIMEDLGDYKSLEKYIEVNSDNINSEMLKEMLPQIFDGIEHIHEKNILHNDIKEKNIFVNSDNHIVVGDFGFAWLKSDIEGSTTKWGTSEYLDPEIRTYVKKGIKPDETNRDRSIFIIPREIFKEKGGKWDLYAAGITLERILKLFLDNNINIPEPELKYYRLIINKLIGHEADSFYNAKDVYESLRKAFISEPIIPELAYFPLKTTRIPVEKSVPITDKVEELINHKLFIRLEKVCQLGLAHNVYPGGRHSREEHSLGVYNNALFYLNSLLENSNYPLFRQMVKTQDLYSLIAAALLHDIGHFPFAHAFEDYFKEEWLHEKIACDIITGNCEILPEKFKGCKEISEILISDWRVSPIDVSSIISAEIKPEILDIDICRIFRNIMNGPIDIDKLDYLVRDSVHTGVPYGLSIDVNRLMQALIVNPSSKNSLILLEKGRVGAENLMSARYSMFSEVYWYYQVRAYESMLAEAISLIFDKDKKDRNMVLTALLDYSDDEALQYFHNIGGKEVKELISMILTRKPYKVIALYRKDEVNKDIWDKLRKLRWENDISLFKMFKQKFVDELSRKAGFKIEDNEIIIDIPNPKRVKEPKNDSIDILLPFPNEKIVTIQAVSPIWEATIENLREWVQQIRVFTKPDIRKKLEDKKIGQEKISNYIRTYLRET